MRGGPEDLTGKRQGLATPWQARWSRSQVLEADNTEVESRLRPYSLCGLGQSLQPASMCASKHGGAGGPTGPGKGQ